MTFASSSLCNLESGTGQQIHTAAESNPAYRILLPLFVDDDDESSDWETHRQSFFFLPSLPLWFASTILGVCGRTDGSDGRGALHFALATPHTNTRTRWVRGQAAGGRYLRQERKIIRERKAKKNSPFFSSRNKFSFSRPWRMQITHTPPHTRFDRFSWEQQQPQLLMWYKRRVKNLEENYYKLATNLDFLMAETDWLTPTATTTTTSWMKRTQTKAIGERKRLSILTAGACQSCTKTGVGTNLVAKENI